MKNIKNTENKDVDYIIGVKVAADDCNFINMAMDVYLVTTFPKVQLRVDRYNLSQIECDCGHGDYSRYNYN